MKNKETNHGKSIHCCKCYFIIALVLGVGALFWVSSELHALKDCTIVYNQD